MVKYFNEQVLNANKTIIKKLSETEILLTNAYSGKEKLKANFLHILNGYVTSREELGAFKTREKDELAETARNQTKNL